MKKIAEISYDEFNDSAMLASSAYNCTTKKTSLIINDTHLDQWAVVFKDSDSDGSVMAFFEDDNQTVPVVKDAKGRIMVQPITRLGKRYEFLLAYPETKI
jgi:hypothetical protein